MKLFTSLAWTVAVIAVGACTKSKEPAAASPDPVSVKITEEKPPPGGTWADVVNATSAGAVMGNPNAALKLVEIGSLSCPVCKRFDDEGVPPLIEKYVKTGRVSWEFRPYIIHGAIDMAANLIARCNGAKTLFPLVRAAYKDQEQFLSKVQSAPQEKVAQVQSLPPNQVFVEMAKLAGLQDWAAARGISPAKSNQCLGDQALIDQEVQLTSDVTNQYPDFYGTPSFILNGKLLPKDSASWAGLEPQLQAALK